LLLAEAEFDGATAVAQSLQLKPEPVTFLLPFLAYFRATGDESRRERTKVFVTQVEERARISPVLLAF
jgi:hypothetical protein